METIYVVTNSNDPKTRYEEQDIGYRIVRTPAVGDTVLDVLTVAVVHGNGLQVDSQAAFGHGGLTLSASARWGDQYEEGAEIELRDAILSALFYPPEQSNHPAVCRAEGSPLGFLRWCMVEGGKDFQVFGQYWEPHAEKVNGS